MVNDISINPWRLKGKFRKDVMQRIMAQGCMYGPWEGREGSRRFGAFYNFVKYAHGVYYNHEEGGWFTWRVHKPWCDHIEERIRAWENKRKKRIRTREWSLKWASRTFGKSVIDDASCAEFITLRNPNVSIALGGQTDAKCEEMLSIVKAVLSGNDQHAKFEWLYGNWSGRGLEGRMWASDRIVHSKRTNTARREPSIFTVSVQTGATGMHPDVWIFDDPISEENLPTDMGLAAWINKVIQHMKAMMPVVLPNGISFLIGTKYRDLDMIGFAIRALGIKSVAGMRPPDRTIRPTEDGHLHFYYVQARDDDGNPVLPEQWSDEALREYEKTAPMEYMTQMMGRPDVGVHMPLDNDQIEKMYQSEMPGSDEGYLTLHQDTAFSDGKPKDSGDHSVAQIWLHYTDHRKGEVCFLWGRGSRNYNATSFGNLIINQVKDWRRRGYTFRCMTDEKEKWGKEGSWRRSLKSMFAEAGAQWVPFHIINRGPEAKKTDRVRARIPFWQTGCVHLYRHAEGLMELKDQMVRLEMTEHDDWRDAAADVFEEVCYSPRPPKTDAANYERDALPTDPGLLYPRYTQGEIDEQYDKLYGDHIDVTKWVRQPIR